MGVLDDPAVRKHMKTTREDLFPIDLRVLWSPDSSQATPGVFHNLYLPVKYLLDPLNKTPFVVSTIGPDEFQSWEAALKRFQEEFATLIILYVGLMHQHLQDEAVGVNEHMPLAPFHSLPAIVAPRPPF